jgi:hypothetical protein
MDGTMVYANLILTFGLGMLVTAVTARLSQARRALEMVAKDVPTEDSVARYIEGIVERDLPTALHNVFEDRQQRLQELREEVRRSVRREAQDVLERPEFHQRVEQLIHDKLTRGAFATHVKQQLDEQYRALSSYVTSELIPRAVEKGLADTGKIAVLPQAGRRAL